MLLAMKKDRFVFETVCEGQYVAGYFVVCLRKLIRQFLVRAKNPSELQKCFTAFAPLGRRRGISERVIEHRPHCRISENSEQRWKSYSGQDSRVVGVSLSHSVSFGKPRGPLHLLHGMRAWMNLIAWCSQLGTRPSLACLWQSVLHS